MLNECGLLNNDFIRLCLELKKLLLEQNESYLECVKNQGDAIIEKILNKWMEQYFASMFEDIRQERSLIILLSPTNPDSLRKSKFRDHEINIETTLALEILHRQKKLKEYVAISLLE